MKKNDFLGLTGIACAVVVFLGGVLPAAGQIVDQPSSPTLFEKAPQAQPSVKPKDSPFQGKSGAAKLEEIRNRQVPKLPMPAPTDKMNNQATPVVIKSLEPDRLTLELNPEKGKPVTKPTDPPKPLDSSTALANLDAAYKKCTQTEWSLQSQEEYLASAKAAVAAVEAANPNDPFLVNLRQLVLDITRDVENLKSAGS